MIEPITYIALLGAIIGAAFLVRYAKTSTGLGHIVAHFQNYAVIVILAALLKTYVPILSSAVEPSWSILWPSVSYIFFYVLLGALALANYYFGLCALRQTFAGKKFGGAKVFALGIGYTILLLSLLPLAWPG